MTIDDTRVFVTLTADTYATLNKRGRERFVEMAQRWAERLGVDVEIRHEPRIGGHAQYGVINDGGDYRRAQSIAWDVYSTAVEATAHDSYQRRR